MLINASNYYYQCDSHLLINDNDNCYTTIININLISKMNIHFYVFFVL